MHTLVKLVTIVYKQLTTLIHQDYELRENLHRANKLKESNSVLAVSSQKELNQQIPLQPGVTVIDREGIQGEISKVESISSASFSLSTQTVSSLLLYFPMA